MQVIALQPRLGRSCEGHKHYRFLAIVICVAPNISYTVVYTPTGTSPHLIQYFKSTYRLQHIVLTHIRLSCFKKSKLPEGVTPISCIRGACGLDTTYQKPHQNTKTLIRKKVKYYVNLDALTNLP